MTIQSPTARVSFPCNGVSAVFPVNIQAYLATDFLVLLTNAAGSTTLNLNSDYTLVASGSLSPPFWSLTTQTGHFVSPYVTGNTLQVILNPSETQLTQYTQGQAFPSLAVQTNLDRLTQMAIRLTDQVVCTVRAPDGDVSPQMALPGASQRALKYSAFDGAGNAIVVASLPAPSGVSPIIINQAATNQQFANAGAVIQRLNDRVMIGDACINDGLFPNVTKDWLSAFQTSQAGGPANGTLLGVQCAVLGNSAWAGGAFLAAAQSLNIGAINVLALSSFAVNNTLFGPTPAWAYYGEAHRMNNVAGQTVAMELDVVQRGSLQAMSPYSQAAGEAVCYIAAAGAGMSAVGQFNATCAFMTGANPMPFDKGIVFQATSIAGTDGVNGTGYAIALAKGHVISWWATGGVQTGTIVGIGTTNANATALILGEAQFIVRTTNGLNHTLFQGVAAAVNYLTIFQGATANPVVMQATGGDANVDLEFTCAGSGTVRFGSSGMFSANGAVATSLGAVGPAGSHTTVQEWLTIKDAGSGAVRFIPCF